MAVKSSQTSEIINRLIYFCKEDIKAWALTEVMNDIIAEDVDARISTTLRQFKKGYGIYSGIFCIDSNGKIIASSEPRTVALSVKNEDWFRSARSQKGLYVGELRFDPLVKDVAINLTVPIIASYEPNSQVIGYLSSRLNWREIQSIIHSIHVNSDGQSQAGFAVLINNNGNVICGPEFLISKQKGEHRVENVIDQRRPSLPNNHFRSDKLNAAKKALNGENGFTIEKNEIGEEILLGYAAPAAYRGFVSSGWAVLVVQNLADAFAPISRLRNKFITLSCIMGLFLVLFCDHHLPKDNDPSRKISTSGRFNCEGKIVQVHRYTFNG